MTMTISAIYTQGVLRPVNPLDLPEGTQVELRVMQPTEAEAWRVRLSNFWDELDAVAQEIGAMWPSGVSALQAVREGRRDL
jgi:predicted DNA-binding antitoxin AbrB/MazE fold protein